MSIMGCKDCGQFIDTDECGELFVGPDHDDLLCESCVNDARWCERWKKRCDEVEVVETELDDAWGQTAVIERRTLMSDCCGEATLTAEEFAS